MTLVQQITYRAKAILAAFGIALVGLATWVVENPDTAAALRQVVPAPYDQFVPVVLGAIAVILVHRVPNRAPDAGTALVTSSTAPAEEVPTWTTVVRTQNTDTGEFNGDPAH